MTSSVVQQQSGLQHVVETRHDDDCASLNIRASTVQAMMSLSDRVLSEVRLDRSARPWALLAVVEEKEGTKAAYFIRTLLADTVQRVLDNYKAPDPQAKGYVSPLSAALLRLASKFSKICLSESVLATNCTVAVLDVKLEKIYTVMCGTDAHLPVVTEQNGEALKPIHSTSRELAGVHMSEATFSAPAGSQHRIVLGNSSLWQFVHLTKAGLHAAAYASAEHLSIAEHHHDSATAVLRAALRTVVARCAASSSARTAVLNTLSQLDRLSPGSKLEAKQQTRSGMVPRMRGDVHPNLTAAVLGIDTTTTRHCLQSSKPSSDALAPCTPEATSMMPDVSTSAPAQPAIRSPRRQMVRMRTQSHPDLMRAASPTRKVSPLATSSRGATAAATQSPLTTRSPLGTPPVYPTLAASVASSSRQSSLRGSSQHDVCTSAAGIPLSVPHSTATNADSRPAALNMGWLRTIDTATETPGDTPGASVTASSVCSPRESAPVAVLAPPRLRAALESAQGTEGMPAALSLPHRVASSESDMHCIHDTEGHVARTRGHVRCSSVGEFECAGLGVVSSTDVGESTGHQAVGSGVTGAHWQQAEVSRRWLLMQRHVQVLGLERNLRSHMWHDAVKYAHTASRSTTPSEHGEPVGALPEGGPKSSAARNHAPVEREERGKRGGQGRAASVDAKEKKSVLSRFMPRGRRSSRDGGASPCPALPRGKKSWLVRTRDRIDLAAF